MPIGRAATAVPLMLAYSACLLCAVPDARAQTAQTPIPLYFEANLGQADSGIGYVARSAAYIAAIKPDALVVAGKAAPLRLNCTSSAHRRWQRSSRWSRCRASATICSARTARSGSTACPTTPRCEHTASTQV